jgi:hypothetical protein
MFKRLFWLALGTMLGLGSSLWATRAAKRVLRRLSPPQVGGAVVNSMRRTAQDLRAAVVEGRHAMREREAALRAEHSTNGKAPAPA